MAGTNAGAGQQLEAPAHLQSRQTPPKTLPTSSTPGGSSTPQSVTNMDINTASGGIAGDGAAAAAAAADKPRLTEQEKKSNHIASEQKRRQAIREGFDEMAELVPGLTGQGRSEAIVLEGAVDFIKRLLAERWRMLVQARERGLDASAYEMDEQSMGIARSAAEAGY